MWIIFSSIYVVAQPAIWWGGWLMHAPITYQKIYTIIIIIIIIIFRCLGFVPPIFSSLDLFLYSSILLYSTYTTKLKRY